jgi:hypothetical protein
MPLPILEDADLNFLEKILEKFTRKKAPERSCAKSIDEPLRLVTGIVLEPETPDLQGDIYSADEIRKACHDWVKRSQQIGLQHAVKAKTSMVECWISPVDFELDGHAVKKGTWLMTTHIEDDQEWELVQKGGFTGYSIGGRATVHDLDDSDEDDKNE